MTKICIALLGPTASGKSEFAMTLSHRLGSEILSLDSTTVYKGFDIGSSKPIQRDRALVPHHLLDILDPQEEFSAGKFVRVAEQSMHSISEKNKIPLIVGGTYFYLRALQHGMYEVPDIAPNIGESIEEEFSTEDGLDLKKLYDEVVKVDPELAKTVHFNDRYRLIRALTIFRSTGKRPSELKPVKKDSARYYWMKYALLLPRGELVERIRKRTDQMLMDGLLKETEKLRSEYPKAKALQSVGYKECCDFLDKKITNEKDLKNSIIEKTRQLAKRQMTWLRSDPEVRFLDLQDTERVILEVSNMLSVLNEKAKSV